MRKVTRLVAAAALFLTMAFVPGAYAAGAPPSSNEAKSPLTDSNGERPISSKKVHLTDDTCILIIFFRDGSVLIIGTTC